MSSPHLLPVSFPLPWFTESAYIWITVMGLAARKSFPVSQVCVHHVSLTKALMPAKSPCSSSGCSFWHLSPSTVHFWSFQVFFQFFKNIMLSPTGLHVLFFFFLPGTFFQFSPPLENFSSVLGLKLRSLLLDALLNAPSVAKGPFLRMLPHCPNRARATLNHNWLVCVSPPDGGSCEDRSSSPLPNLYLQCLAW